MSLHYWLVPEVWRNWWVPPPLSWWIDPSGGDVAPPKPWSLWDRILESPITAHSIGALVQYGYAAAMIALLPLPWALAAIAFGFSVKGQLQKADGLLPLRRYNIRNVVYRLLIAGVACLLMGLGVAIV